MNLHLYGLVSGLSLKKFFRESSTHLFLSRFVEIGDTNCKAVDIIPMMDSLYSYEENTRHVILPETIRPFQDS